MLSVFVWNLTKRRDLQKDSRKNETMRKSDRKQHSSRTESEHGKKKAAVYVYWVRTSCLTVQRLQQHCVLAARMWNNIYEQKCEMQINPSVVAFRFFYFIFLVFCSLFVFLFYLIKFILYVYMYMCVSKTRNNGDGERFGESLRFY